jgi:predicted esterase
MLIASLLIAACGPDDAPNTEPPRCMEGAARCAELDASADQPDAALGDMAADDMASDGLDSAPDLDAPEMTDVAEPPDLSPDMDTPDMDAPDMEPDPDAPDMEPDMALDMEPEDMAPDMMGLPDGPSSQRLTMRPIGTTSAPMGFYEYLPPGYGDGAKRPLLLFLHGLGENGAGNAAELPRVLRAGLPPLIQNNQWPSARPFVVLSPQHPGGGCTTTAEIAGMLTYALANYDIDPRRVYITGLSCGAIGAWEYLGARRGEVVAAAVLIAGDGRGAWNQAGCALGEVAIWGFHGDADPTVYVEWTRSPMNNLIACPQPPREEAKLTIYPGVGHDSWTRTYNGSAGHDIYTWLLSKQKAPPPPTLAPGRSVRIDLGANTRTTPAPWNNLTGHTAGATANRLTDEQGTATSVSVTVTQSFEGTNQDGAMSNQVGFPTTAGSDTLWTGSFDGHMQALSKKGVVQISGLEPGARYDLTLFASRTGNDSGAGRLTRYTVAGQTRDLEVSDNTAQAVALTNIMADAQGRLTIEVAPSPAGSSRFAYLGVIDLKRR